MVYARIREDKFEGIIKHWNRLERAIARAEERGDHEKERKAEMRLMEICYVLTELGFEMEFDDTDDENPLQKITHK